jgi:hypothetical protein
MTKSALNNEMAKADVKAHAQQAATEAAQLVKVRTEQLLHLAQQKTPAPVRNKAVVAAGQLSRGAQTLTAKAQANTPAPVQAKAAQAALAARSNRKLLAGSVTTVLLLALLANRRRAHR